MCVYPRMGYEIDADALPQQVSYARAPIVELSSTWIRNGIAEGHNMNTFLPEGVYDYICHNQLYRK